MTSFCLNLERLKHGQWYQGIIVVMVIFLGVVFARTDCQAQAVPSRNQSQMMTRPIVRPPEPPLQKEIGDVRQEVRDNKVMLERKIAAQQLLAPYTVDKALSAERLVKYMDLLGRWLEKRPERGKMPDQQLYKPLYDWYTNPAFCAECQHVGKLNHYVPDLGECLERVKSEWGEFGLNDEAIRKILEKRRK